MARARNIKPGFYKNEDLAECSVWARYIFPGLWMLADKEGRLEDRPKRIKGELLPFDSVEAEPLLRELASRGFIVRYQNEGASFIQISKFKEHQSPHYSEKDSVIKPPDSGKDVALMSGEKPPDSLIPDSLNPEKALSGKPDPRYLEIAKGVLGFLNEKTGKHYRPVEATLKPIVARLREGATEQELRQVIAKKYREWGPDEKMADYLRPKTLFNATNFANYVGELAHG